MSRDMAAGLTLGSLFDGIAGFPLAAAELGIKTVWTSEIESNCIEISAKHFPEAKQLGDITKLSGADIAPVDIISFGSPCQNLSVAGNGKGLDGFPDRWTEKGKDGKGISDNARYKALGNSIAIPCAVRIFRGIIAAEMEGKKCR